MTQRLHVASLVTALCALLLTALTAAVLRGGEVVRLDRRLAGHIAAHQVVDLVRICRQVSLLGEASVSATLVGIATVILLVRRDFVRTVLVPVVSLIAVLSNQALRHWVGRSGPVGTYAIHVPATAYPSGHVLGAALVAVGFACAGRRWWISALACAGAVIVGLSRMYLMAHFASDVVASLLIGGMVAASVEGLTAGYELVVTRRLTAGRT